MEYESVMLGGVPITEPTVAATNFLITIFGLYWYAKLYKLHAAQPALRYWMWFFLLTAVAMVFGGLGHATRAYVETVGVNFFRVAWILGALSVSAVEMSAIVLLQNEQLKRILTVVVGVQFIAFTALLLNWHSFQLVNLNSALGTVGFLGLIHAYYYLKQRRQASGLILTGMLIMPLILIEKALEMKLFMFNHHDIAHFILIISMYFFYLGARALHRESLQEA
ncbi:MAG: hypothetical protein D6730_09200 [Bacteroidetes bacterium]|nr:MAG: hypothetical protein D6730_09200 [Bacteroidota bacterium]